MTNEIDINSIIKDEQQFRLYVALKLQNGDERMGRMEASITEIKANGCAKSPEHAELDRRLKAVERDSSFSKMIAATVGSIGGLITGLVAQLGSK